MLRNPYHCLIEIEDRKQVNYLNLRNQSIGGNQGVQKMPCRFRKMIQESQPCFSLSSIVMGDKVSGHCFFHGRQCQLCGIDLCTTPCLLEVHLNLVALF